jgi:hypothetical protein
LRFAGIHFERNIFYIYFRNNLTIIDAIVLEGQCGKGELKLNNKKPGISTLQFDIAEKHLKNCDSKYCINTFYYKDFVWYRKDTL